MPSLTRRPNRSSRQFGTPRGQCLLVLEFPEGDALGRLVPSFDPFVTNPNTATTLVVRDKQSLLGPGT